MCKKQILIVHAFLMFAQSFSFKIISNELDNDGLTILEAEIPLNKVKSIDFYEDIQPVHSSINKVCIFFLI